MRVQWIYQRLVSRKIRSETMSWKSIKCSLCSWWYLQFITIGCCEESQRANSSCFTGVINQITMVVVTDNFRDSVVNILSQWGNNYQSTSHEEQSDRVQISWIHHFQWWWHHPQCGHPLSTLRLSTTEGLKENHVPSSPPWHPGQLEWSTNMLSTECGKCARFYG